MTYSTPSPLRISNDPPWRGYGEGMGIFWNHTIRERVYIHVEQKIYTHHRQVKFVFGPSSNSKHLHCVNVIGSITSSQTQILLS